MQEAPPAVSRRVFRVAAFGLSQRFLRMLDMILDHDHQPGGHRYQLADTRTPGEFDIALVNLTAPGGVDLARRLRSLPRALPVIGVGRRANRRRGADDVLFSSFAQDILGVLNRAADTLTVRAQQQAAFSRNLLSPLASGALRPAWDEMLSRAQLRVLIIDPSPSSRSHVAVGLRQLGIDAEGVGNLVQAADVLSMRSYDLIIIDPRQPDGDGLEMLRRFKRATGSAVPVVVLSEQSTLSEMFRSALAGCSGYLVKPLSVPALHATARRILLRHLHRRQRQAIGAIPMATSMAGRVLMPRLSWRMLVASMRTRCVAGLAAVYGKCLLKPRQRELGPAARVSMKSASLGGTMPMQADSRRNSGEGATIDSLQLSPAAVPVWRPGSPHTALDLPLSEAMLMPVSKAGASVKPVPVSVSHPVSPVVAPAVRAVTAPRRAEALALID
ncbi:MAG: response regulator [Lautropia sp.]|nr:response regulator [Lautropia sp.]